MNLPFIKQMCYAPGLELDPGITAVKAAWFLPSRNTQWGGWEVGL